MEKIDWREVKVGDLLFIGSNNGYLIVEVLKAEPFTKLHYRWIFGKYLETTVNYLRRIPHGFVFLNDLVDVYLFEDGDAEEIVAKYLI